MKKNQRKRFINVGCGTHPINGWINYDFNVFIFFAKVSILRKVLNRLKYIPDGYKEFMDQVIQENIHFANAGKHIPERDNSVNVIYSSHMLEHLDREETDVFLSESRRVLVPDGIIRIVVPDFEKLIENYQKNKNPQKFIDDSCLSGEKPKALLKKIQYLIQGHGWHFCMYNKTSIIALFKRHGFQNIRVIPAGETMIPLPDGLDLNVHENNSLYLEANI